jgi:hypothetical protein
MFRFENLERQYPLSSAWARKNDPVPLAEFLLSHKMKVKE